MKRRHWSAHRTPPPRSVANPNLTVHVTIVSVSGLLKCDVCSDLISFKLSWADCESGHVDDIRCPRCKGGCSLMAGSIHPEIVFKTNADNTAT